MTRLPSSRRIMAYCVNGAILTQLLIATGWSPCPVAADLTTYSVLEEDTVGNPGFVADHFLHNNNNNNKIPTERSSSSITRRRADETSNPKNNNDDEHDPGVQFLHFVAHNSTMTCSADEHARPFNNQIRGVNLGTYIVSLIHQSASRHFVCWEW